MNGLGGLRLRDLWSLMRGGGDNATKGPQYHFEAPLITSVADFNAVISIVREGNFVMRYKKL